MERSRLAQLASKHPAAVASCLVLAIVVSSLVIRLGRPSPGLLWTGDQAFLAAWGRYVADSNHIGLSDAVISAALAGDTEGLGRTLLVRPGSLAYALLFGLYENPEKVTRLVDMLILSFWQRFVSTSEGGLELFAVLWSTLGIVAVFGLARLTTRTLRAAVLATALYAFLPGQIASAKWVSWHAMGQAIFTFVIFASLWCLERLAAERAYRHAAAAGLLWGIALYSNSLLPFFVPLVLLPSAVLFVRNERLGGHHPLALLAVYCGTTALVFAPAMVFVGAFWTKFVSLNIGRYAAIYWLRTSSAHKLMAMTGVWTVQLTFAVTALAVVGAVSVVIGKQKQAFPLIAWVASFLLFVAALGHPDVLQRTNLMVVPPLTILAAIGVDAISRAVNDLHLDGGMEAVSRLLRLVVHVAPLAAVFTGLACLTDPVADSAPRRMTAWLRDNLPDGSLVISDFPNGIRAFSPTNAAWGIAAHESVLARSERREELLEYLVWRYPDMATPPPKIVLALVDDGKIASARRRVEAVIETRLGHFGLRRLPGVRDHAPSGVDVWAVEGETFDDPARRERDEELAQQAGEHE